nr:MAG TPA: hypothetical protein [Bacteriophage sp.]
MIDITLTTMSLTYNHWTYNTIFDVNLKDNLSGDQFII